MTENPNHPIRVMVVDDHSMVRRGLATFIRVFSDLELVAEAGSGEEAIKNCTQVIPDVILMDMVLPDMDGAAVTRIIHQQHPSVRIIALSSYKDETLVLNVLHAGAIGYLLKDISADELAGAIRAAAQGHSTFSPEAAQVVIHAAVETSPPGDNLTKRERIVLALMIEGLNNTQIAARLFVSPSTVKSHVSNILSKMDVSSRAEAVALAVRHKMIN